MKNYLLSSVQIDDMKHCIGFSHERVSGKKKPKYEAYRNHFTASDNDEDWDALVVQGLARKRDFPQGGGNNPKAYCVSELGFEVLGEILGVTISEME